MTKSPDSGIICKVICFTPERGPTMHEKNVEIGYLLDFYGRKMPKPLSCTKKTGYTSSTKEIMGALVSLFRSRTDVKLAIKKIGISLDNIIPQNEIPPKYLQFDLFTDTDMAAEENAADEAAKMRERSLQTAVLGIRSKFGKNSLLRGISYQEGATARERNMQIGGHRA